MGPVANEPRWTDQRLVCLSALEFEPKHLRGASFSPLLCTCWARTRSLSSAQINCERVAPAL